MPTPTVEGLFAQIEDLRAELEALKAQRPGRRRRPIEVSEPGVCGLTPSLEDSGLCTDYSLYRYQQGCRGEACRRNSAEYYAEYRQRNKPAQEAEVDLD